MTPLAEPSLFLATNCYGGQAHIVYMRSLLALQDACVAAGVRLRVKLGAGEALVSRARAAAMALFLRSAASHLLMVDAALGFEAVDVLRLLGAGKDVVGVGATASAGLGVVDEVEPGLLLTSRAAAERMSQAYANLAASLRDLRWAEDDKVAMVFDSFVDPKARRYLSDHEAFCRRWRDLGGELWADGAVRLLRPTVADDAPAPYTAAR